MPLYFQPRQHKRSVNKEAAEKASVFCSLTTQLKDASVAASNAFVWLQAEMENHQWRDECHLHYKTRTVAEERAKLLRDLRLQKEEGVERAADDQTYGDLLVGHSTCVRCSIVELFACEADICALATGISDADAGATISIQKRVRQLARAYLKLFDAVEKVDAIAGYEPAEVTNAHRSWCADALQRHGEIKAFLRLFDSRCNVHKPVMKLNDGPIHVVHIEDLSTVFVDGAPLKMNRARTGALFTLAVLGTDAISVQEFAVLYNDDLHRNKHKAVNHAKIFQQALDGLRKSMPHLTVIKPEPHLRTVGGLALTTDVSRTDLTTWLHGRTG